MKECFIKCKHVKKKVVGLLLTLVMLVGMLPVNVFAEASDWDPTTSASAIVSSDIRTGATGSASTTKYLGEGDIQLKVMPTLTTNTATYNAMAYCGVQVTSKNSEVVEVKENGISIGKWQSSGAFNGADALQVEVTPKSVGTTNVIITFYYTFSQKLNPSPFNNPNAVWYKGQNTYTVTVKDRSELTKPNGPTEDDANRFRNTYSTTSSNKCAVYMYCDDYDHQAYFPYLTDEDVSNGYSFGEVVENDGSKFSASQYPWMCVMTVDHNAYLKVYNSEYGTHYLQNPETTTSKVTWYYDADSATWKYPSSNAPIYIDVVHEQPVQKYTVTYTDGVDGEEVFEDQTHSDLSSGTATPAFEAKDGTATPKRTGYVFNGWSPELAETVTGDVTYTATWSKDENNNGTADDKEEKYTVTYTDGVEDEEVFADQVYPDLLSGTATPAFEAKDGTATPTRTGYVFKGWSPEVAGTVTGNATYTAIWSKDENNNGIADDEETKYTVTYTDGVDGEEIFPDQVYPGLLSGSATPAFAGGTPTREGYVFKGWNPAVAGTVTGDATYVATWEENKDNGDDKTTYTVTYKDGVNGTVFADQVHTGLQSGDATPAFAGGTPTREGYVFKGWNPEVTGTVTGDATYTATWEEDKNNGDDEKTKYTVTYKDGVDGKVFADQVYSDLASGSATPAFTGGTPKREGYVFNGWSPEVAATVTGNITYTATWKEDKNNNGVADDKETKYTVTYTDGVDGKVVFEDQVYSNLLSGSKTPAFEGGTPKREGYVFKGWNPEVTETVTGNVTYTATWKEDKNNNGIADDEEKPADTKPGATTNPTDTKPTDTKSTNTTPTDTKSKDTNQTTKSANAKANETTKSATTSVQTGDTNNIFLWVALIFVSVGVVAGIMVVSKKRKFNR